MKKQIEKTNKARVATIYLGMNTDRLSWNGSYEEKSREYFFSLAINNEFIIQSHHGMPYTQGGQNQEFIERSYEELIEKETTAFAQELRTRRINMYRTVNGDRWDFFNQDSDHEEGGKMSDDVKSDFLDNLEAKLKGRKKINRALLKYDQDYFRDSSMDGAPP